ncbi:MAG: hypothetical protein JNN05_01125 [Candidatus Omnitrophica bacterium]|nr:hypothetical protein [Candidatus Omnitrophota bacterium]
MIKKLFCKEDLFYAALLISLFVHLTVVGGSAIIKGKSTALVRKKKIEVVYKTIKPQPQTKRRQDKSVDKAAKAEKITLTDSLSSVALVKEHIEKPDALKMYERTPEKVRSFNAMAKKTVYVPAVQSEKINNPNYANYYSLVRARIKQRAYFNYSDNYIGEVYLTFILTNDGVLKELQILENRTTAQQFLRTIGLKSVKEAAPFPPFPKELNYPELTFNVVISFQMKDEAYAGN